MANVVKIKDVTLYTTLDDNAVECWNCKKVLDDAGVKYSHLHYHEPEQVRVNAQALSTWTFGPEYKQHEFKKFPIVHWVEYYDDYERWIQVVTNSVDLAKSNVVLHKDKVV